MSIRRKPGDWVWLSAGAGLVGEANRLRAEIQPEDEPDVCMEAMCGDQDCQEWATVCTEPDPRMNGLRHTLCHVPECQMFDERQGEE